MNIGIFDSGIGGMSVLHQALATLPHENYIFYADTDHVPYGTKTKDQVISYVDEMIQFMLSHNCKAVVIACNTATSAAASIMRQKYTIPIIGIEPAVKPAVFCMDHPRVLVMATPMTIHAEKFHKLMDRYADDATIIPLPCPGLMDFVERGDLDGEDLHKYLNELLYSYRDHKVDAAVLGCTHYPFAREQIQSVLGEEVRIFDGGEGTAREMRRRLAESGLLRDEQRKGTICFENSQTDGKKIELCKMLLDL